MIARFVPVVAALLLLAACSTSEESLSDTAGAAGAGAGTSGLGSSDMGAGNGSSLGAGTNLAGNTVPGTQADLEVNVGDRVFYGFDSSVLDDTGRQTVERQAAWLQQF